MPGDHSDDTRGHDWRPVLSRLGCGLLIGATVSCLPWLVGKLDVEALWPVNALWLPGIVVALVFSGGNVHTYDFTLSIVANIALYMGFIYLLLSLREKRKRSN